MSLHLNDGEAVTFDAHGNVIRRRKWKDEHGNILRDGEVLRVPMMFSDSKSKPTDAEVIAAAKAVRDGAPVIDAAHQRPRSAVFTDEQKRAAAERQTAYDKRLSGAWKADNAAVASHLTPEQEAAAKAQAEKDAAERAASPNAGYDRRVSNAWRDTRPDAVVPQVAAVPSLALDQARSRYHQRLENAWQEGNQ